MEFSLFICFEGNCKEAVDFYAKVFNTEVKGLTTFGQMPPDPNYTLPEEDRNKVMYADVNIFGTDIMFSDIPSGMPYIRGNNINPTLATKDTDEIKRVFNALKEGGKIEMALQETFWSKLYGMVTDQFGITWQLSHDSGKF